MIVPVARDAVFVAQVHRAMKDRDVLTVWWLGQSGFLVHYDGMCIALDPYLSDSLTEKYAQTAKPHVRLSERVVDPGLLDMVSLVTSSHNHTDHLDAPTCIALAKANPALRLACSAANVHFAMERMGPSFPAIIALTEDVPHVHGPFTLHVVPAAHNDVTRDAAGNLAAIGLVIEVGGKVLYHSGDTLRYDGMAERLRHWRCNAALLPINGNDPARGVAGNLSAAEAVALGRDIDARIVVPCHYDMFAFNTADPKEFVRAAGSRGHVMQLGESLAIR
jgi:L-ascorbate metabolism protein UlaG (beta-lactamase superfamily)